MDYTDDPRRRRFTTTNTVARRSLRVEEAARLRSLRVSLDPSPDGEPAGEERGEERSPVLPHLDAQPQILYDHIGAFALYMFAATAKVKINLDRRLD